ncbi:MAG: glycosyltransferase family 4 protein [Candidatus Peregrinibacteria bacterium]|nr:glycosyltransferase family 4 protein [Candidatus Peregrinibacteria bacterium]
MRILILGSTLRAASGWGTYGRNSVLGLRARGHTVRALVRDSSGEPDEHGVLPEPHHLLGNPFLWFTTAWQIRRAIKDFKPDIIHILVEPYVLAMPFVRMTTKDMPPWVLSIIGTYSVSPLYLPFTRRLLCSAYRRANAFAVLSHYTQKRVSESVVERCGEACAREAQPRMTVFPLGIEDVPKVVRRQDPNCKHILFVSEIKPRKGVREIINACAEFKRTSTVPFHMHFVGNIPKSSYTDEVLKLVKNLGLETVITFHGAMDLQALHGFYEIADLCLVLGISDGHHFEGHSLVFLEGNLRGIPAIGPIESGGEEAIEDGVSGYCVDPKNPAEVAERMRWILEEHRITPEACRKWALEHSVEAQAECFEKVYEGVLQRR